MDSEEEATSPSELQSVVQAFENLHFFPAQSVERSQAIHILADTSKRDIGTRQKLADAVVLRSLIESIDCSLQDSLDTADQALRCIGNACIDNDDARKELTALGFSWALRCLACSDYAIASVAVMALYNICLGYPPAQQTCFDQNVHHELIEFMSNAYETGDEHRWLFTELLFLICQHKPKSKEDKALPSNTLRTLVRLPSIYRGHSDVDQWVMLLETSLLFFRDARVQSEIVHQRIVELIWRTLQGNEKELENVADGDDQQLLTGVSTNLIWCLSDIAATAGFAEAYGLETAFVKNDVIGPIKSAGSNPGSRPNPRITTAACQLLGNLLWSLNDPETFKDLVEREQLHVSMLRLLLGGQDVELLHAACGLLVHLSRPSVSVRELIVASSDAEAALVCLCMHENPQLKQDGIKLLRALGKDSPANQRRFASLAEQVVSSAPASEDAIMNEAAE